MARQYRHSYVREGRNLLADKASRLSLSIINTL